MSFFSIGRTRDFAGIDLEHLTAVLRHDPARVFSTSQISALIQAGIDPQVIVSGLSGIGGGASGGASGSGGTSASPPGSNNNNLLAILAAIPIADDGQVITRDHHNTMRTAILALAGQLGGSIISPSATLSFAPALLTDAGSPGWAQHYGFATKPVGGNNTAVDGWMQLYLPDGVRIQSFRIIGEKSGDVGSFVIKLMRQPLTGTVSTALATIDMAAANNTFSDIHPIDTALAVTNNTDYKYLVSAKIIGAEPAATVQLNAFQLVCSQ